MTQDRNARVACETLVKTGIVVVAGEITTTAIVDMPAVIRQTIKEIGYTSSDMGFDCDTCAVLTAIEKQSPDISQGVTEGEGLYKEQGAGDQGLMFGYATDETPELMPAPIMYAHQLAKRLADMRKHGKVDLLRPDGKTQVTIEYENDVPVRCDAIVVSTQHAPDVKYKTLKEAVIELVIEKVIPKKLIDKQTKFFVNPTGRFVIGGPYGDCGLTGRKIIVDTYGGMGRHGGGAFSGKDPSKVDRSACYYARYVAKNVVAAGLAKRCEVQIAYAIGVAQPVGVHVNTFGTGKVSDDTLGRYILKNFDMRPKALIEELDLLAPRLPPHRGLRPLRPLGVHLGEDDPRGEARRRSAAAGQWRLFEEEGDAQGIGKRDGLSGCAGPSVGRSRRLEARGKQGQCDPSSLVIPIVKQNLW